MDNKIAKLEQARLRAREKGFTLVELAIVLVIIGLIIGGVLVGQDLIKAAEIRAQITQIEQYNAAVNTFRTKYNGLPGDLRNATSFFPAADFGTSVRNGNGNRQLEQCGAAAAGLCGTAAAGGPFVAVSATTPTHDGEVIQFWHHLSLAELINGSYNGTAGDGSAPNNFGGLGFTFPVTRLDRNGVGVFAAEGRNFYQLGVISGAAYDVDPSLSAEEAFNLDSKIDDGRPGSGSVVIRGGTAGGNVNAPLAAADVNFVGGATPTACIEEAIADPTDTALLRTATYALGNKDLACTLRLRMN